MFGKSRAKLVAFILVAISTFALFGCSSQEKFEDILGEPTPTSAEMIDISNIQNGTVKAHYSSDSKCRLLVRNGDKENHYVMPEDGSEIAVPLNFGDGDYQVEICENKEGTRYVVVESVKFNVANLDNNPYLQPSVICDFTNDYALAQHAAQLCSGLDTDEQKMVAITEWVVDNITYDKEKAKVLSESSDYYPVAKDTYSSKTGICYDYASLVAAMLRSQGVPTKVITGTQISKDAYHSWNQVFIDGEWITVDTCKSASSHTPIVVDEGDYSIRFTF